MHIMTATATMPDPRPDDIRITAFTDAHIPGALRLSRDAGWPHRAEDWALNLSVSRGVAALQGGEVVGTALCSEFGDIVTLNMIVVDARMRGQGLGRRLMQAVFDVAGPRETRLVATQDGLPLYEKLGFTPTGKVAQHQGIAITATPDRAIREGSVDDVPRLAQMEQAASGLTREGLLHRIASGGTVLLAENGFAMLRDFGRGIVIGPVVAHDGATARALITDAARRTAGTFLRIDLPEGRGLSAFVETLGLAHVGGGIAMHRQAPDATGPTLTQQTPPYLTFALVSQAVG